MIFLRCQNIYFISFHKSIYGQKLVILDHIIFLNLQFSNSSIYLRKKYVGTYISDKFCLFDTDNMQEIQKLNEKIHILHI